MCQLNNKLISVTTSLKRSQTNFTAIINAHKHTNSENFAKIGVVLFYVIIFEPEVKSGSSFGSLGHRRSLKMVPFDRSHTTSKTTLISMLRRFGDTA